MGGMPGVEQGTAAGARKRRVGRPTTLDSGGRSLAAILELIRDGVATTRLEIESEAELGRAVVSDVSGRWSAWA